MVTLYPGTINFMAQIITAASIKPDIPLPKGAAFMPVILFTSQSRTAKTTAANKSENHDEIANPGVKNAVIANITAPTTKRNKNEPKPDFSFLSTFSIISYPFIKENLNGQGALLPMKVMINYIFYIFL